MERSGKWHFDAGRFAQGMVLLNFVLFLYKIFETGEISRLVAPFFMLLTSGMALLLGLLAVYAFITCLYQHKEDAGCVHCSFVGRSEYRRWSAELSSYRSDDRYQEFFAAPTCISPQNRCAGVFYHFSFDFCTCCVH